MAAAKRIDYGEKMRALPARSFREVKKTELAKRLYYMYMFQQQQIQELRDAILELDPDHKFSADLQKSPITTLNGDDPCCCQKPNRPPYCPPLCEDCPIT